MNNLNSLMMSTLKGFREATETRNWEQVQELDATFREQVAIAVKAVQTEEEREVLTGFLRRAQSIYELVKAGAEKNKNEIAGELAKLSRDHKAASSYLKSMELR